MADPRSFEQRRSDEERQRVYTEWLKGGGRQLNTRELDRLVEKRRRDG